MCKQIILIAEDDPDDQELIQFAFSQADASFQVYMVNDGKEALDYLKSVSDSKLPCLILLDYNMPELNGAQVIQRLSPDKRFEKIPKIILSTSENPKFIAEALMEGAHAYRVKPDNFQQLIGIAKEMVALCKSTA